MLEYNAWNCGSWNCGDCGGIWNCDGNWYCDGIVEIWSSKGVKLSELSSGLGERDMVVWYKDMDTRVHNKCFEVGKSSHIQKCNQSRFKPKSCCYNDNQQMALHLVEPVGKVINLEISGVCSEWAMYCFNINIDSSGKKVSNTCALAEIPQWYHLGNIDDCLSSQRNPFQGWEH